METIIEPEGLTRNELRNMCFRDFAEKVNRKWRYVCDYEQCPFESKSAKDLEEHKQSKHAVRKNPHNQRNVNVSDENCYMATTAKRKWVVPEQADSQTVDKRKKHTIRNRDKNSGHWQFTLSSKRRHIRPSTVLYLSLIHI